MKKKKQIISLLTDWGKSQKDMFSNYENVKLKTLGLLNNETINKDNIKVKKPIRFFKFGLAISSSLIVLLYTFHWLTSPILPKVVSGPTGLESGSFLSKSSNTITASDFGIEYSSSVGLGNRRETPLSKVVDTVDEIFSSQPTTVPAIDTREYSKFYYQAGIKTRQVESIANRVQTIVRGYNGRVDSSSINKKNAYISFVIPKKSFELFKDEVAYLVGDRFITVSSNSQNLLGQKINIEDNTKTASSSLANYQTQKTDLTDKHNKTITNYQTQLNYYSSQIWSLQQTLKNTTSTSEKADLNNKINLANYQ